MECIGFTSRKVHQGTAVGLGTDSEGREVAVGIDRRTWDVIGMGLGLVADGDATVHCDVESWRVIARREAVSA